MTNHYHLLAVCRYILCNPVAAGLVTHVEAWPWSSYHLTAGLASDKRFAPFHWLLDQFDGSIELYRDYIATASLTDNPLLAASDTHVLGSKYFRKQAEEFSLGAEENPRRERYFSRLSLVQLKAGSVSRSEWMARAYRRYGYTMREIAEFSHIHYSLVSRLIKAWEDDNSTFKT